MNNERKIILIAVSAFLLVVAIFFIFTDNDEIQIHSSTSAETLKSDNVTVYISGQVKNSAVVTLDNNGNLRLVDVVNAVGGLTEYADSENINLAEPLIDGQHIHIPAKDVILQEIPVSLNLTSAGKSVNEVVNINTADEKELEKIRGVGSVIAGRIIEYRNTNGPFKSIEEIKKVRGIGEKIFEKIRDDITVDW